MTAEQSNTVQVFKKIFFDRKDEKIIIYGTGINAEAVVTNCVEFQFAGLLDAAKTGEQLWGLNVLTIDDAMQSGCKCIVIVARPAVHSIIYERIKEWTDRQGIEVYDIYGNLVKDKAKGEELSNSYFDVSYECLRQKIQNYDVISFDIFDTLLVRNTYEPTDVFKLLDVELGGKYPFVFSEERIKAEREMAKEADIHGIYQKLAENCGLGEEDCATLMQKELEKELQVLAVRKRMAECLAECVAQGKTVYLVSDMYLTKDILTEILTSKGILGYQDIYVSCEWGVTKRTGLFEILKRDLRGKSCLHIGDNHEADYAGARSSGLDAFEILAPIRMLELSTYSSLLKYIGKLENRVILGMLAAKVFNDPFGLYQSKGKPTIDGEEDFGYVFVAPLLVAVVFWIILGKPKKEKGIILFSARDGWFVQQIYKIFSGKFDLLDLPEDIYFYVSRKAIMNAVESLDVDEAANKYIDYVHNALKEYDMIYYFDFMSKGTCQYYLQKIIGREVKGLYVQRSYCDDEKKNVLEVEAFYKETSALENDRRLFAMCDFLECVFTSFEPSFAGMDVDGNCIFEKETRNNQQLECVRKIQAGMLEYSYLIAKLYGNMPKTKIDVALCDDILRCTSGKYSEIKAEPLKEMELDNLGENKNVGIDILV